MYLFVSLFVISLQAELCKILSKSISITNYNFLKYFNFFCQLLPRSSPKYKILLAKVIEIQNTIRTHYERINQLTNIRLINKET